MLVTRGKLSKQSTVLVSVEDRLAIDLLLKYRSQATVNSNNVYLFAKPVGSVESYYVAQRCLKVFCMANDFDHETITATNLRKHLANETSTLSSDKQRAISMFMGHSQNVHNIYRQANVLTEVVNIGRILDDVANTR